MTDNKFEIRIRCTSCGLEESLASVVGAADPLLFDDAETALSHAERLGKKSAQVARNLGINTGIDIDVDTVHECPKCHAMSRIRNLTPIVFKRL